MKRILLAFAFVLLIFPVPCAETPKELTLTTLPVSFTAGITHYAGFLGHQVSNTIRPADSEFLTGLEFSKIDDSGLNYTTDDFYFFIQVFDMNPVAVSIISAAPLKNGSGLELSYTNSGSNTMGDFPESDTSISEANPREIYSESEAGEDCSKPRHHNLRFNFNIPVSSITETGKYTSSIKMKIETEN